MDALEHIQSENIELVEDVRTNIATCQQLISEIPIDTGFEGEETFQITLNKALRQMKETLGVYIITLTVLQIQSRANQT